MHGARDPLRLAQLRTAACTSSADVIATALTGTWRDEQVCILTQALEVCDFSTRHIAACDAQIERPCAAMKPRFASDEPSLPLPRVKPGSKLTHQPGYNARTSLARLPGVDLVAVTGLSASLAQTILAAVGTDRSTFPTVQHFCSWLGLAPHNDISGGRVLRSRTLQVVNRATQALRQAAQAVVRSDAAFGAYFRARRARLGPQPAIVATAHKIARVVSHLFKHHEAFTEESATAYTRQRRERELKHLTRRANNLGYMLTPVAMSQPACVV